MQGSIGPTGSGKGGEITYCYVANNGVSSISFNNTTFSAVSDFYYSGSTYYGASPTQFTVIVRTNGTNGSFTARIVDMTNSSNIIATITGTGVGKTMTILSTTTFANVSTTPAIWELQIIGRPAGGNNTSSNLHSMYIRLE